MGENEAREQRLTLKSNLKQHIADFSNYTTFHGAHFVIGEDRGIFRRIIWLVLILIGLGFLAKQLVESYSKLESREHVITREINSTRKLVFPAVTICNENMMKKSKIEGTDAQVYLDLQNTFKEYLSRQPLSYDTLKDSFEIKKAVLQYGHTAKDMMKICTWDGKLCSHRNVTTRFSQIYGLCHTFNSGREDQPLLYSTSIKRSRGLHLLLDVKIDEYYGIASYFNTGIRMVIHDQNEEPMVEVNGINIMPGHMTTINIERTEYESLPSPYKSKCGSKQLKTSNVYTQSTCLMECNTLKVVKQCGCRLLGMPEFNDTKYCSPKDIRDCLLANLTNVDADDVEQVDLVMAKYFIAYDTSYSSDNPERECSCPKPCKKIQYKITQLNTVSFLSASFWKDYYQFYLKLYPWAAQADIKQKIDLKRTEARENFLVVIMNYEELHTLQTYERPSYDITDFGSDVGGYLGLFLGCSILTVVEIFDFIISYFFLKHKSAFVVEKK